MNISRTFGRLGAVLALCLCLVIASSMPAYATQDRTASHNDGVLVSVVAPDSSTSPSPSPSGGVVGKHLRWLVLGLAGMIAGAVTVTYAYPVAGTVAPTVAQAAAENMLTATVVIGADTDTTTLVTHNWQLTTAQLANNWPVVIGPTPNVIGTAQCTIAVVLTNSVAITLNKGNVAGSAGTYIVTLLRPHSIIT